MGRYTAMQKCESHLHISSLGRFGGRVVHGVVVDADGAVSTVEQVPDRRVGRVQPNRGRVQRRGMKQHRVVEPVTNSKPPPPQSQQADVCAAGGTGGVPSWVCEHTHQPRHPPSRREEGAGVEVCAPASGARCFFPTRCLSPSFFLRIRAYAAPHTLASARAWL